MLRKSQEAKDQLTDILRKQGYATYARLLQLFDFYFTDDPNVIAYMIPQRAAIVMNEGIKDEDTASVLIRHEILHEYLTHYERQLEFDKAHPELNPSQGSNELSNIAADYEISNKGYTDADKVRVRSIMLNDKTLSGLVTEDDHQDWANLTFEEMYERLLKERQQGQSQAQRQMGQFSDLDASQLQDLMDQIDQLIDQIESQPGKQEDGQEDESEGGKDKKQRKSSQSSNSGEREDSEAGAGDAGDAENQLNRMKDQVSQMQDQLDEIDADGKPFDSKSEVSVRADVEARAKRLHDELKDVALKNGLIDEVSVVRNKERVARAAKQNDRYMRSGIRQFTLSLNRYIKNEIESGEDLSYKRPNPSYSRSDFLIPSITQVEGPVPLINVYHDVSGSFDDERKTAAAMQAIATLNKYVRQGELKIKVYYFADRVSSTRKGAGGGTRGTPILEHIKDTKPQNVIVITDSDIYDCSETITVPGAVWMLFYDATSENLIEHLKGRKETRWYLIEY